MSEYMGKEITGELFNQLFPNMIFIKLTNETENHNEFQFHDGLNIDDIPFYPIGECIPGGIYFTKLEKEWKWIKYRSEPMKYMRKVSIPNDARVYIERDKCKADKL